MKKTLFYVTSLMLVIMFSSWGFQGHKKINGCAPPCFPQSLSFLQGNFSTILVDSASAADNRKQWDDTEAPKHYLDIDNYPEFILTGRIPMSWDSITLLHNMYFILDNGTLPWATEAAFDSVRNCFARGDQDKAALFAADLGHYVGDGHQPLHITANYDGQLTGNDGIHSRYETSMINGYLSSIIYPADSAQYIQDVPSYVFTYIYANRVFIDSIFQADNLAKGLSGGSTNSSIYKQALWNNTKYFTINLFRHASFSLASLIYTAYIDSQHLGVNDHKQFRSNLEQNFPNPAQDFTVIPVDISMDNSDVSMKIFNATGRLNAVIFEGKMNKGHHQVRWDSHACAAGFYYCVLKAGEENNSEKISVIH